MAQAPPGSMNAEIERASSLLGRDAPAAGRAAEGILRRSPNDPRALLILASSLRRRGDHARALLILTPLAKAFPRAAMTHYELGVALGERGDRVSAVVALRHAVAIKNDLAEAWRALGDQLFALGDAKGAEHAFAAHDRAMVRDPALAPAADALYGGQPSAAEALLRRHLAARPDDAPALRLMAETMIRQGRVADAESLIARALAIDPEHDGARFTYASTLFQQQKAAEALAQIQTLMSRDPNDPAYLNLLAGCLALIGDFERVIETYEGLLARFERQPKIWLNYGHALRTVGRSHDAVVAYRRAIALAPGLGDAYWSLANLKVAPLSTQDEAEMLAQAARADLDADDRLHLHYALGKAMEDRAEFAKAFEHYALGARMRRAESGYDPEIEATLMRRSKATFTPAFFDARRGWGSTAPDPIFIVGLPRSGSTLIEQILASHSAVEGTMELPDIGFLATDLARAGTSGYPNSVAGVDSRGALALGQRYLSTTRVQRKLDRPHFIDKMPNNFRHIGLIHLILPNARIIDARRHPLGSCFSAFKQHFAQGQGFSYDLGDLGRYYRDYVELMAHFDAVLPGRVHRVVYEDLVENTEVEVSRLLAYCGLPFEEACLRFYENGRAVRTVSSEQVRRPIFRQGLDQWRRFEPWLDDLKTALGPALDEWR